MDKDTPSKKSRAVSEAKSEEGGFPDLFLPLREKISRNIPKDSKIRLISIAFLGFLSAFLFVNILDSQFSAMLKALGSAILFILTGEIARAVMGWDGFWGLILFRDRRTLSWIDRQAKKYEMIWVALADVGLVLGYGLSSWFLIGKKQQEDKMRLAIMYLGGILLLFLFSSIAAPMAMPIISGMLSGGDISSASLHMRESLSNYEVISLDGIGIDMSISVFSILILFVLLFFGLSGSVMISLVMYAVLILPGFLGGVASYLGSLVGIGKFDINSIPPPGGSPILPGVNLPFVEGILALAGLLVVHEMSHGLLARIAKVKLDSAGLVFFGILPFGAFVEPDEKEMQELKSYEENRILVAGSASNIIFSILSLFVLTGIVYMSYDLRLEGYSVTGGNLPAGVIVQSIDGQEYFGQNLSLPINSDVKIVTDEGEFVRTTDENGKVGINMNWIDKSGLGFRYKYVQGYRWIEFILNTLGLLFATNMLVGIVNLLPIPLFDGNRLMTNGVKNERIAFAITAVASGAFLVNLLPWIFR